MHKIKQVYKDLWSQDLINATIPQESYLKSNRKKKKSCKKKLLSIYIKWKFMSKYVAMHNKEYNWLTAS